MSNTKHTPGRIRIQNNTDANDIYHRCLGLSCWIEGDSTNQLNTNRGLHIQIRHNKKSDVFVEANRVANLIAAAPDMLEALKRIIQSAPLTGLPLALEKDIQSAINVINNIQKENRNI